VPREQQIAYFETYVPTIVFAPLTIEGVGTVLGPIARHGIRTPDWKLVVRSFVGPCTWGAAPSRDPFGTWSVQNATALSAERCAELGQTELYRSSDGAPDGVETSTTQPPEIVATLKSAIAAFSAGAGDGNAGQFTLSDEQERKLKSLGYLQ
jgi:hypothetical protein